MGVQRTMNQIIEIADPFEAEIAAKLAERELTMLDHHRPMVIYAVVRRDLEMQAGKLSSQAGHAYCEAIEHTAPELLAEYKGTGHGTKLTLEAKNEGQLKRVYREAKLGGFPCYLVFDRSHVLLPHFTGKPILTGVSIGPVYKSEVEFITKRLKLVN